jgi:hypothetical protein
VNEVEFFIATGSNINAYDKACMKRILCHDVRNSHFDTSELSVGYGARSNDLDTPGLTGQDKDLLFVDDD